MSAALFTGKFSHSFFFLHLTLFGAFLHRHEENAVEGVSDKYLNGSLSPLGNLNCMPNRPTDRQTYRQLFPAAADSVLLLNYLSTSSS